ncbi:MAG: pkn5 [Chlamydiales bacterium]|jgi:serine/threonine protein kinase|nr:pkn5 [Chlamydiales bacterium]
MTVERSNTQNLDIHNRATVITNEGLQATPSVIDPPKQIGSYQIQNSLAQGGMSQIFLGIHQTTGEIAAVKLLSPKYSSHPIALKRFQKEGDLLQQIKSPYITSVKEVGSWQNTLYIATEYIAAIPLREIILTKRLPLDKAVELTIEIAQAVAELHTQGLIHRDLKPENILVTEDGHIKIIDLGIAKLLAEKLAPASDFKPFSQIVGTPAYMSPEQKENPHQVGLTADIYSLGIIIYELMLGQLCHGVIQLLFAPSGMQKIIRRAIHISPQERFPNARELLTALVNYLSSPLFNKDQQKRDQNFRSIDFIEQEFQQLLPNVKKLEHPQIDFGLIQKKGFAISQIYHDFIPLQQGRVLTLIAESSHISPMNTVYLTQLRHLIHWTTATNPRFAEDPIQIISSINCWLKTLPFDSTFTISYAIVAPNEQQVCYLSSGSTHAWIIYESKSVTAHSISSHNLELGKIQEKDAFSFTIPWTKGSSLILASKNITSLEDKEGFIKGLLENSHKLSAQEQLETLWNKIYPLTDSLIIKHHPATLIALRHKH